MDMNWQCRLYGHYWRHPGAFEVIVTDDSPPSHPIECAVCGDETVIVRGEDGGIGVPAGRPSVSPTEPASDGAAKPDSRDA